MTTLRRVLKIVRAKPWRGVSHDADGRRALGDAVGLQHGGHGHLRPEAQERPERARAGRGARARDRDRLGPYGAAGREDARPDERRTYF